jgi:starvation-inducible DNA-binding protein
MEGHEEMAWMLRSFIEGEALQADGSEPKQVDTKIPASV